MECRSLFHRAHDAYCQSTTFSLSHHIMLHAKWAAVPHLGLMDHLLSNRKQLKNRLPWAKTESLPFLYCVTLCRVCFLHFLPLQKVRRCFGTFTCTANAELYNKVAVTLSQTAVLYALYILFNFNTCKILQNSVFSHYRLSQLISMSGTNILYHILIHFYYG